MRGSQVAPENGADLTFRNIRKKDLLEAPRHLDYEDIILPGRGGVRRGSIVAARRHRREAGAPPPPPSTTVRGRGGWKWFAASWDPSKQCACGSHGARVGLIGGAARRVNRSTDYATGPAGPPNFARASA